MNIFIVEGFLNRWRNEEVSCYQNSWQAIWSTDRHHANCSGCQHHTFLCVVVTPEFCITQSIEPGMLTPKDCIPEHFKDCQQTHYSDCILLSEPTSAAKQLYFILEMLEPFWLQITKKTVNYWLLRTKFSAFLEKIQQHVHDPDIPSNR